MEKKEGILKRRDMKKYIFLSIFFICLLSDRVLFAASIYKEARFGSFDKVKRIVEKRGKDIVNKKDKQGKTVLHYAADALVPLKKRAELMNLVSYLIKKGVKVNEKDSAGKTPLYYAERIGNHDVAKLLIANGAKR